MINLKKVFFSFIYYTKTAGVALAESIKEQFAGSKVILSLSLITSISSGILGSGMLKMGSMFIAGYVLLDGREKYLQKLFNNKMLRLTMEERKLLHEKCKENPKQEDENISKRFNEFLANYKIQKPYFFKVSKDNRQHYFLGTIHSMSFSVLPDFVQRKIKMLSSKPNVLIVEEMFNPNAFKHLPLMYLMKLFVKKVKENISFDLFKKVPQALLCPWYLKENVDPRFSIYCFKMRNQVRQIPFWGPWLVWFIDSPGLGKLIRLEIAPRFVTHLNSNVGMDTEITGICQANACKIFSLENLDDGFNATGLRALDKMTNEEIFALFSDFEKTVPRKHDNRFFMQQWLETYYKTGILSKDPWVLEHLNPNIHGHEDDHTKAFRQKLNVLGIDDAWIDLKSFSKKSVSVRNLNWFPILTNYMEKYQEGLIYFGETHLQGQLGLLNLLRHEGYNIEKVIGENQTEPEPTLESFKDQNIELQGSEYLYRMSEHSLMLYYNKNNIRKSYCKTKASQNKLNLTSNGNITLKM